MISEDVKIVICTGGFDPIHSGHIQYLQEARTLGDMLVVGLNSDDWLTRKKGKYFMSFYERFMVLQNLKMVDLVMDFDDTADTACQFIYEMLGMFPNNQLIFANGGDRPKIATPEYEVFENHLNIIFKFGIGGDKKANSSSWILEEWKAPKTQRNWGYYRVLNEQPEVKVKELVIDPLCSLSMQRHHHRSEIWLVTEGSCLVDTNDGNRPVELEKHDSYTINKNHWHKLINPNNTKCKITEIQYGEQCVEDDIERIGVQE